MKATADPRGTTSFDPSVKSYPTSNDLLAVDDIDIVSIATPPSSHADLARAAMRSGKHVLIEKPIATTASDAARIIRARYTRTEGSGHQSSQRLATAPGHQEAEAIRVPGGLQTLDKPCLMDKR